MLQGSNSETIIVKIADLLSTYGVLPALLGGTILAGILASTMSTADSQLLAASSAVSSDLLGNIRFIPVNNKNGTTNAGDLKLKINYDIVTKVTDTSNLTSTITNKEVSLPKNTFKKGTKHTYVLTIKMNAIKITVEDNMEGWTDDSDSDINVEK